MGNLVLLENFKKSPNEALSSQKESLDKMHMEKSLQLWPETYIRTHGEQEMLGSLSESCVLGENLFGLRNIFP